MPKVSPTSRLRHSYFSSLVEDPALLQLLLRAEEALHGAWRMDSVVLLACFSRGLSFSAIALMRMCLVLGLEQVLS